MGNTAAPRELVVDAVVQLINDARKLTDEELTGLPGCKISGDILIVLAWQLPGDDIVNTWFIEHNEPTLSRITNIASKLDIDHTDINVWRELFAIDLNEI